MTTKIKWRLANRPTPKEVQDLFTTGLLNKDEAREILFSLENDEDRDKASMESEIKFLRDLVQRLSSTPTQIIQTIKAVEQPYIRYPWYGPYVTWCANTSDAISTSQFGLSNLTTTGSTQLLSVNTSTADGLSYSYTTTPTPDFSEIKTF